MRITVKSMAALALVAAAGSLASPAWASDVDLCKAVTLRPVPVLYGDGYAAMEKGIVLSRVTQYVLDRKTGRYGFCVHFGTCYLAYVNVNGHRVQTLRLLNCKLDFRNPDVDEDEIIYGVEPDPKRNSIHDMRLYRAFVRLLDFGVESEALARSYVDEPRSRCATIARRALAGDRRVREALRKAELWVVNGQDPEDYLECI